MFTRRSLLTSAVPRGGTQEDFALQFYQNSDILNSDRIWEA